MKTKKARKGAKRETVKLRKGGSRVIQPKKPTDETEQTESVENAKIS